MSDKIVDKQARTDNYVRIKMLTAVADLSFLWLNFNS